MSVNEATINYITLAVPNRRRNRFTAFIIHALGCWHLEMGRPITASGETYRACVNCGARRCFDEETWKTKGPYYF